MKKIKLWHILSVVFLVVLFGGAYSVIFLMKKDAPLEFFEARARGSEIAKQIVGSSQKNLNLLSMISKYDLERNYTDALTAVSRAVISNRENSQAAIRLSSQLEIMARAIVDIERIEARQLAIQAISNGIELVSRLLKYNSYLAELFEILKLKFSVESDSFNPSKEIQDLVSKINEEARIINDLDIRFNDLMAGLDKELGR